MVIRSRGQCEVEGGAGAGAVWVMWGGDSWLRAVWGRGQGDDAGW